MTFLIYFTYSYLLEHHEAPEVHADYETVQNDPEQTYPEERDEVAEADNQALYEGDDTYEQHHDGSEQDRPAEHLDEVTALAESDTRDDAIQQGITSDGHDEEAHATHNQDEGAGLHSASTSGSLDILPHSSIDEEKEKDVVTLEAAEENTGEELTYEHFDPSQDFSEEADAEYEDGDYEEQQQAVGEMNEETQEDYQEQDLQQSIEHQESEHAEDDHHTAENSKQDEASEYQDENPGDVNDACEYFSQ